VGRETCGRIGGSARGQPQCPRTDATVVAQIWKARTLGREPPRMRPRMMVTRYWKRPLSLPDGAIVRWGDRVALLQPDDGALTGSRRSARSALVNLAARRIVQQSLGEIAQRLSSDPALRDVRAVGILVDAPRVRPPRGVSVMAPCRRLWARVVAWYQRGPEEPSGPTNHRGEDRRRTVCIWMSTPQFVDRYGRAPAQPEWPSRRHGRSDRP
jgi:hypothetical protein